MRARHKRDKGYLFRIPGGMNMVKGYVLISLVPGLEENTLSQVRVIPGVKDVTLVFGRWDALVEVKSKTLHELSRLIISQIRGLQGIQSTETLVSGEL